MKLKTVQADHYNGQLDKHEYIDKMHEIHSILFDYAEFIKGRDIKSIEITDDLVVMTSRNRNVKIICDKNDKRIIPIEILNFGSYEESDFNMILNLITDKDCVLDIGANIGWFSINVGKIKTNCKIMSFEPIPKTFDYLKRNIELNNASNVQINNFGFSNEEKEISFYYNPEGSGNASSANLSGKPIVQEITCQVKKLDDFIDSNKVKVDFIKCDVEGAELLVMQGGLQTIKTQKPIIFTELLRKWASHFNYHPNEVIELFGNLGYRCFTAKNEKLIAFGKMDDTTVETNFFFLHSVEHLQIIKELAV